jgi:hypothetical protein
MARSLPALLIAPLHELAKNGIPLRRSFRSDVHLAGHICLEIADDRLIVGALRSTTWYFIQDKSR